MTALSIRIKIAWPSAKSFGSASPKTTAEQMDAAKQELSTSFLVSMNVDRYNVYVASPNASGVQPVIMVEPGVIRKGFSSDNQ